MKRWLLRGLGLVVVLLLVVGVGLYWLVRNQGASPDALEAYEGAKVRIDDFGIPTIDADSWPAVVEAQGYVTASQRFFHMDMIRRFSAGRVAELYGAKAVPLDEGRRLEDWPGVVAEAEKRLEPKERELLEAYARGVNRFLQDYDGRVSLEYLLLGVDPEPWKVEDTLFITILMSEQLATAAPGEALRQRWSEGLGDAWFDFLFPVDHPWNKPLFGTPDRSGPAMPATPLPAAPLEETELARLDSTERPRLAGLYDEDVAGWGASNSWAWCGGKDCYLANDPHLAASVPHLWFLNRLRVDKDEWAVGVSIPGAPGVVLGMNAYLAWAFTNVGEDVDDYLREELSDDGKQYVERIDDGEKIWAPVIEKKHVIRVKDGAPVEVTSRHTSRGPIAKRDYLGDGVYARRWLPLQPGLAVPSFDTNRAKSWDEMMAALDGMRVPAQNVLVVDRLGNMGYRASGTGIVRSKSGRFPRSALDGDWQGYEPASARPRMQIYVKEAGPEEPRFIATANERIWVDPHGQKWTEDLRKDRIRTVLASKKRFKREEMEALQMDTNSRYHKILLDWLVAHAKPDSDEAEQMLARWTKWGGDAKADVETFTEAIEAERLMLQVCLGRVRKALLGGTSPDALPYRARLDSAWMLTAMEQGFDVFGFTDADLATQVVATIAEADYEPYPKMNRWKAQHAFVGRVPVVGDWFAIEEREQVGWSSVPRVERPKFGASTRMVWDLMNPQASTWITPVGQSGHPFSPHYDDLAARYHADQRLNVFDDGTEWFFAER